jgi:hypothetical protein
VLKRDRDGFAVAGASIHAENRVVPDQLGEHRAATIPAPGVDSYHPLDRIALSMQCPDKPGQQASTVVRDDYRGNGMPGLGRGS